MEGKIVLSHKELHRIRVFEQVVNEVMSLGEACRLLGLSYRQTKRMSSRYLLKGALGLLHGNRGRRPSNVVAPELRDRILQLSNGKYGNFNDTHFTEMLKEREDISLSRESVRKILRSSGKGPKRRRRPPRHRSRRPRIERAGMMVQWDGSPHHWFGEDYPPCCLLSAMDDADGRLLGALFVPAESSEGYLRLLAMILLRHGIPLSVYHDRHNIFIRSDDHWSIEEQLQGRQYPTHVGRVLEELAICSISANSPQAKGRVERGFGTFQDRLIAEMGLEGITDMETANEWLEKVFIRRYNSRFGKKAAKSGNTFRAISKAQIYLRVAFAYEAVVGNDNCIRLGGLMIDIPPGPKGRSYARKKVLVRQHFDGKWTVWLDDQKIGAHKATPFKEPVRSWKMRSGRNDVKGKKAIQVYISSKPAPPNRGHFPLAVRGSY